MHKLDILVATYEEPIHVLCRFLDSISVQRGFSFDDIRVAILADRETRDGDTLPEYPFKVERMYHEHAGVSATRNDLLRITEADHVMLCDCDDTFLGSDGIATILRYVDEMPFDVLTSTFMMETDAGPIPMPRSPYFIHGKVFRRKYLIDNDISWLDRLYVSGDLYFLWQALSLTDKVLEVPEVFYVWRDNKDSVCRHEDHHFERTYHLTLDGNIALTENFLSRGRHDLYEHMLLRTFYHACAMMDNRSWHDLDGEECTRRAEGMFREWFARNSDRLMDIPLGTHVNVLDIVSRSLCRGMTIDSSWQWARHMLNESGTIVRKR